MGNEQSGDQDSDKDELNSVVNQQNDTPTKDTPQVEEKKVKTILSDMYPEDMKTDENISIIPTEAENIESKTIEEFCPEFEENLNYSKERLENFQTSFRTKAVLDKPLQNTLNFLTDSIKKYENSLMGKEGDENYINKLKNAQQIYQQSESDFENNQSQITKEKSDQVYIDLEKAKDTLKKKREELSDLKETCARLFQKYTEMVNSQSV